MTPRATPPHAAVAPAAPNGLLAFVWALAAAVLGANAGEDLARGDTRGAAWAAATAVAMAALAGVRAWYAGWDARRERDAGLPPGERSRHPTVKSIALMRWLTRLVTPPNGLVPDPFAGSGSTGVACVHEGFRFLGVEQDPEYARVATARLQHAVEQARARGPDPLGAPA